MRSTNERGIALITTLLVMMLISALLVAFTTVVMTDQRFRFIDKDRGQAFYGAAAGVEKLTADLGNTFLKYVGPTNAQIAALAAAGQQPVIPNISYTAISAPTALPASELSNYDCNSSDGTNRQAYTVGGNGYTIMYCGLTANSNPTTLPLARTITQGTFAGLYALKTPYQIDVTAKTTTGGEVHLARMIETVAIPVFQFGIFSDVDQSFHSGPSFSFGGRVHTNGNLFLAVGDGNTLTLSDKVTAYKDVIRAVLPNGNPIANNNSSGTVNMLKGAGTYRALASTEGSVVAGPGSSAWAGWTALSLSTYKGYIKDGAAGAARGTGAKQLTLPIVAQGVGGTNVDILRRPKAGEDMTSILYQERLYQKASIRVLLSDTAVDITNLPGVDNTAPPLSLETGTTYGSIPIAISPGQLAVTPVSSTAVATSSTNSSSITLTAAQLAQFKIPDPITITGSGHTWTLSICGSGAGNTGKTVNTFTGCTLTIAGAATTVPIGATVTGTLANGQVVTTTTTATTSCTTTPTCGTNKTITVSSTLAFSPTSFWIDDQVVSCTGYNISTNQLTGCNVLIAIPNNNEKLQTFSISPAGTSLVGGFIKIERQNAADRSWHDITPEILGWGIAGPAEYGSCAGAYGSTLDPSPNGIIRLQRLADDYYPTGTCVAGPNVVAAGTGMSAAHLRNTLGTDYWPNTLFDAREAWERSAPPAGTNIKIKGVMHYVTIDVANLAKWFAGQAPYNAANPLNGIASTGTLSMPDNGGYSIYVSDRRNNRDSNNQETAEFGFEDFVNPASATGTPNGLLDTGEDVNANGVLDVYGRYPSCGGTYNYTPGGSVAVAGVGNVTCSQGNAQNVQYTNPWPPDLNGQPDFISAGGGNVDTANINGVGRAMVNRAVYFRRAVKLVRGSTIAPTITGFTVVTENPVYIDGDWNANGGWTNPHAATAILADSVTLLSNNWTDRNSFLNPYNFTGTVGGGRIRSVNSWYRVAVLSGKGAIFPLPAGEPADFGSDGGAHNFLRMLEGSPGGDTVNYQGSLASLFYNRQSVGVYKTGNLVYAAPTRAFAFDTDFLQPTLLPPLTPMFRDMDTTGFSQNLQPGK
ncbi:MAG TPA: pilus assembly PilX N-terminal domain-containing protein [Vicinamibacterales bacterium]|nr:pilus assembly PilX N-terminal domain-containing protein [Vicinamibacterales bacterium]